MEILKKFIHENKNLSFMDVNEIVKVLDNYFNGNYKNINNLNVLTGGYMNPLFTFEINNEIYVYRYPGKGSEKLVNRTTETLAHKIAKDIGLDDSLLYIDEKGHKITKFISQAKSLDYHNEQELKELLLMMKKLHSKKLSVGTSFEVKKDIENYWSDLEELAVKRYPKLEHYRKVVFNLINDLGYQNTDKILCHNDIYSENILISDKMYLIDWEFANDTHPALDLATFIVCSPYEFDEVEHVLKLYLEDEYSQKREEYLSYFIISSFYWLLWAIYTEYNGESTNGLLENYYRYLEMFYNKLNL